MLLTPIIFRHASCSESCSARGARKADWRKGGSAADYHRTILMAPACVCMCLYVCGSLITEGLHVSVFTDDYSQTSALIGIER